MSKGSAVKNHEKAEAAPPALSQQEILRYSRHLIMPEVGMEGQLKLKAAKVLLIGAGGLGAPLGLYLAAAGVGRLGLVDFDVIAGLRRGASWPGATCGSSILDDEAPRCLVCLAIRDLPTFQSRFNHRHLRRQR